TSGKRTAGLCADYFLLSPPPVSSASTCGMYPPRSISVWFQSRTMVPCGLITNRCGASNDGCCGVALKYHIAVWPESNKIGTVVLVSLIYFATVMVLSGGNTICTIP